MGACGYTCEEVHDLTYRDYLHKIKAHNERIEQEWSMRRWQVWHEYLLSPYIKSQHKPKSPADLFRLPSEREQKITDTRTAEEKQEVRDFFRSKGLEIVN